MTSPPLCLSHSAAQASQISAQKPHHLAVNWEPRAMTLAQAWQISAVSRQRRTQSAICGMLMHWLTHSSQVVVQSRQSSMQDWLVCWLICWLMRILLLSPVEAIPAGQPHGIVGCVATVPAGPLYGVKETGALAGS